ncbi:MAG: acetyl-CoA carboxylase biotin carboxyl carrier protein subunit [Acidobacteriota bacterium]
MEFHLGKNDGVKRIEVRRRGAEYTVFDGKSLLSVDARRLGAGDWSLLIDGASYVARVRFERTASVVELEGRSFRFELTKRAEPLLRPGRETRSAPGTITAPMPGRVVRLCVRVGQEVKRGAGVVVVEAMKMENELTAPRAGVVAEVRVAEGDTVEAGALLVRLGDPPAGSTGINPRRSPRRKTRRPEADQPERIRGRDSS